jgi:hypothetical protein
MSLSEILTDECLYGKNPHHVIVKCIYPQTNWPEAGALEVGKIYDAYFCEDKMGLYVVINRKAYFYDGSKRPKFITEDFPQLEKLLFIGRKNARTKESKI